MDVVTSMRLDIGEGLGNWRWACCLSFDRTPFVWNQHALLKWLGTHYIFGRLLQCIFKTMAMWTKPWTMPPLSIFKVIISPGVERLPRRPLGSWYTSTVPGIPSDNGDPESLEYPISIYPWSRNSRSIFYNSECRISSFLSLAISCYWFIGPWCTIGMCPGNCGVDCRECIYLSRSDDE